MAIITATIFYFFLFLVLYFQVFLILTYLEVRLKEKRLALTSGPLLAYPSVTILVPCFNEEKTVGGTLDSLLALDYPREKIEILAIDDGSTDNTWKILESYRKNKGVRIIKKPNGGKYTALNIGLAEVRTDIVGCLDADSFVSPDALKKIVIKFHNPETVAVTPAIVVHKPGNLLQMIQKAEYNMGVFVRKMLCSLNALHVTPGPFSFFRTEIFEKIGGYRHGHNTEDMELAMRLQQNHLKIDNAPDAYVYTTTPKTLKTLHKQRVRWIYGFLKNAQDYKSIFFNHKYGDFGVLYLPFALFSIFAGLYFFFYMAYNIGGRIYSQAQDLALAGFNFNFKFDWFYLNTEIMSFLSIVLMSAVIFILLSGKKLSENSVKFSKDIVLFIIFYSFISPFWFMRAVYNALLSREARWR